MKDRKLKQLFDFQKFEGNAALKFAIESTRGFINSASQAQELSTNELEMLSAAGQPMNNQLRKKTDK